MVCLTSYACTIFMGEATKCWISTYVSVHTLLDLLLSFLSFLEAVRIGLMFLNILFIWENLLVTAETTWSLLLARTIFMFSSATFNAGNFVSDDWAIDSMASLNALWRTGLVVRLIGRFVGIRIKPLLLFAGYSFYGESHLCILVDLVVWLCTTDGDWGSATFLVLSFVGLTWCFFGLFSTESGIRFTALGITN